MSHTWTTVLQHLGLNRTMSAFDRLNLSYRYLIVSFLFMPINLLVAASYCDTCEPLAESAEAKTLGFEVLSDSIIFSFEVLIAGSWLVTVSNSRKARAGRACSKAFGTCLELKSVLADGW